MNSLQKILWISKLNLLNSVSKGDDRTQFIDAVLENQSKE